MPPHQSPAVTASPQRGKPFVRFARYIVISGRLPGRHICRPYGVPVILQSPQNSPSSVTCGDSFPQRGKPFVRFARYIVISGRLPGRHICRPYGVPVILQSPQNFPSSVTCGDSFPQRGKPFRAPRFGSSGAFLWYFLWASKESTAGIFPFTYTTSFSAAALQF